LIIDQGSCGSFRGSPAPVAGCSFLWAPVAGGIVKEGWVSAPAAP